MRPRLALEELFRLLPDLEELDELRLSVISAALPDPEKAWDRSSEYSTIDKRVVTGEQLGRALDEAEAMYARHVASLFATLRRVLQDYQRGEDSEAVYQLVQLGEQHEGQGRHRAARRFYDTALAVSLPLTDKEPQILALRRIARSCLAVGDLGEAFQYYQRSAALARDAGDLRGEVIARTGMGNVRSLQGWWGEAGQLYRDALNRIEGAPSPAGMALEYAQLCNNLGLVAIRTDQREDAQQWLDRATAVWETLNSPDDLAVCYHNRAMLREHEGCLEDAQRIRELALALDVSPEKRAVIAIDLAQACLRTSDPDGALRWGREAENHAIAARSPYHLGHMYRGLGTISRARGESDGVTFFEKALQIARERSLPFLEGETLVDYALLRRQTGQTEEAQIYLETAAQIFRELGAVHDEARALRALEDLLEPPRPVAAD